MFTGIIEEVGRVSGIRQRGELRRITIVADKTPKELRTGDRQLRIDPSQPARASPAGNSQQHSLGLIVERMSGCNPVELFLEQQADGRVGGHIVQGHVDGVGKLIALDRIADSENWWLEIALPAEVEKYTVFKGSISIEGISLTVAKLEARRCTVAVIPHTVEMTNLKSLRAGDTVNLEADLIAKYVEKMMKRDPTESSLTIEELVRQGF